VGPVEVIYIAIDPGLTGAIAWIVDDKYGGVIDMPTCDNGSKARVKRMVDAQELYMTMWSLLLHNPEHKEAFFVEKVSSMPGQGVASMFSLGDSYGVVRGVIGAYKGILHSVAPQKWKKWHGLIGADKEASRILAQKLYPDAPLNLKKHHGRADALLIANYGSLQYNGINGGKERTL